MRNYFLHDILNLIRIMSEWSTHDDRLHVRFICFIDWLAKKIEKFILIAVVFWSITQWDGCRSDKVRGCCWHLSKLLKGKVTMHHNWLNRHSCNDAVNNVAPLLTPDSVGCGGGYLSTAHEWHCQNQPLSARTSRRSDCVQVQNAAFFLGCYSFIFSWMLQRLISGAGTNSYISLCLLLLLLQFNIGSKAYTSWRLSCFFILTLQLQPKCFQINNSMRWILTLNKLHKIVDNPCNTISHFCPKRIKNAPISTAVYFYSFISRTITASYVYLYKILSNNKEQETTTRSADHCGISGSDELCLSLFVLPI